MNHSQTRKSRLTAMSESLASVCDQTMTKSLAIIWEHKERALNAINAKKTGTDTQAEGDADTPTEKTTPFPGIWSTGFCGGTIERVKDREYKDTRLT